MPRQHINETVAVWLLALRQGNSPFPFGDNELSLHQLQQHDPTQSDDLDSAITALLSRACDDLASRDAASAEMLHLYYWQGFSVQAIKNNRQLPESVPTLWRRLKAATAILADLIYEQEMLARETLKFELIDRLPLQSYDQLFGRNAAIAALQTHLTADNQYLVNLIGLGGLGKTALSYATVRQMIEAGDVRDLLWVQINRDKQDEVADLARSGQCETLLDSIIGQLYTGLSNGDAYAVNRHQQMATIRRLLKKRPWLIVIDNIEASDDDGTISEQLHLLANPSRFLLVSRVLLKPLQPMRQMTIDAIAPDAATAFVRGRADKLGLLELSQGSDQLFERLYAVVGGHPQALRLVAHLAIYFSAEIVLNEFESADVRDIETLYNSIYRRVWERQSDHARRLLDAMHLLPIEGSGVDYLGAIGGLPKEKLWEAIRELTDAALLDHRAQSEMSVYHIHSLTDSFLTTLTHQQERSDSELAWMTEQVLAACAYWLADSAENSHDIIRHHHTHVAKLVRIGLRNPATWNSVAELMLALYFAIENSFHWKEWLMLFQLALDHADENERMLQYRLYSRLGTLHHKTDDYEKSAEMHQHAMNLAQSLGDLKGVGREHVHLCMAYRYLNRHEEAAEHGQNALEIFEEMQLHAHFHLAALNSLGQNAHAQTDFATANAFFAQAISIGQETVPSNTLALVYSNWGDTLRWHGKWNAAQEMYCAAHKFGKDTLGHLSRLLLDIGQCNLYLDEGNHSEAEQLVKQLSIEIKQSAIPLMHVASIAQCIGRFNLMNNRLDEAIDHLEQAVQCWVDAGLINRSLAANLLLASAYELSGRPTQSTQTRQNANMLARNAKLEKWVEIYQSQGRSIETPMSCS